MTAPRILTLYSSGRTTQSASRELADRLSRGLAGDADAIVTRDLVANPLPFVDDRAGTRFLYAADRFDPWINTSESGRYVWLPLDFEGAAALFDFFLKAYFEPAEACTALVKTARKVRRRVSCRFSLTPPRRS